MLGRTPRRILSLFFLLLLNCWSQTNQVAGAWKRTVGSEVFRMQLRADGSGTLNGSPLRWTLSGKQLTLFPGDGSARTTNVEATASTLTLIVPASGQRIVFEREGAPESAPATAKGGANRSAPEPCRTLVGAWRAPDLVINFGADGTTAIGGITYRYTADANTITLTGSDGVFRVPYRISGGVLTVSLNGREFALPCVPSRSGSSPNPPELVGRWSYLSSVNLSTGARMSTSYILLNANGTYEYRAETSSSNPYGSSVTDERDYGTWTATETTLTARSRSRGTTTVYALEKRNHPKTRDPMIVLNGQMFVTYGPRAPW